VPSHRAAGHGRGLPGRAAAHEAEPKGRRSLEAADHLPAAQHQPTAPEQDTTAGAREAVDAHRDNAGAARAAEQTATGDGQNDQDAAAELEELWGGDRRAHPTARPGVPLAEAE